MKKILSLALMLVIAFTINAQLNTKILGVTLGQSTKQQVRSAMKQKGYKCIEFADGGLGIQPKNGLYFGGQFGKLFSSGFTKTYYLQLVLNLVATNLMNIMNC